MALFEDIRSCSWKRLSSNIIKH